jgi:hypothetical protein
LRTTPSDMVASFTGAMTEAPVSDDNLARPMTISEIIAYWTLGPATLRLALMLQRFYMASFAWVRVCVSVRVCP